MDTEALKSGRAPRLETCWRTPHRRGRDELLMSFMRLRASFLETLQGKRPSPRWLTATRMGTALFIAGYLDTNAVQRAGIFVSGMSGNMVDAAIFAGHFSDEGNDEGEERDLAFHLLAYLYVLYIIGTMIGHRVAAGSVRCFPFAMVTVCATCMVVLTEELSGFGVFDISDLKSKGQWWVGLLILGCTMHLETIETLSGFTARFISNHTTIVARSLANRLAGEEWNPKAAFSIVGIVAYFAGCFASAVIVSNFYDRADGRYWSLTPVAALIPLNALLHWPLMAKRSAELAERTEKLRAQFPAIQVGVGGGGGGGGGGGEGITQPLHAPRSAPQRASNAAALSCSGVNPAASLTIHYTPRASLTSINSGDYVDGIPHPYNEGLPTSSGAYATEGSAYTMASAGASTSAGSGGGGRLTLVLDADQVARLLEANRQTSNCGV